MHTTTIGADPVKVIFLIADETLKPFAYFPELEYNEDTNMKTGYIPPSKYMPIHKYYAINCKLATEAEYSELKTELVGMGYRLDIQRSKKLI